MTDKTIYSILSAVIIGAIVFVLLSMFSPLNFKTGPEIIRQTTIEKMECQENTANCDCIISTIKTEEKLLYNGTITITTKKSCTRKK